MKRWHSRWLCAGGLAVSVTVFFAAAATAQVFGLGEWGGTLEGLTGYARHDLKTSGSQRTSLDNIHSENRLTLRNVGMYVYDPRLINFSLGGTFGLSNDWLTTESGKNSREGVLWGYDFFASILPEKNYSLNLFADRYQSFLSQELAGQMDIWNENRGAVLFARRLYIPSTLTFRQELREDESRVSSVVARRKDRRNSLTYEGQRGWTDSDMNIRYELVDFSEESLRNLGYQSHEGSAYYSLDFGPELNRRWDSRIRLFIRTGLTDMSNLNLNESLRVDHTDRLKTDYRYSLMRTEATNGITTGHSGAFQLNHRLYENLTTNLGLDASFQSLPGGQRDFYRGGLNFAYRKRLPKDGVLNLGLGGAFQYDDQRFQSTESSVAQESHTATSPTAQPIPLNNPLVITESVVVTKTAFGPLPAGCVRPSGPPTPLVLGRDYTLRTVGDVTEIVPIACAGTSPGINPEDTIAVDYRFRVSPSLTYTTTTWHANLSVDYQWIRPYFFHEQTDQNLLSGRVGRSLDDQKSDTLGTQLRYDGRALHASLLGEVRRFTSHRTAYDMARSNQTLGYAILPEMMLTLSADQALYNYPRLDRQTRTIVGRATLSYSLGPTIFADSFAGLRFSDETQAPGERTTDFGLRVRWTYRNIDVLPSVDFSNRRRGATDAKDYRATLRMIRRF